jgi:putative hydrolase of the HAD superfamily
MPKYKHIFFDLDHTLWDFETNSKNAMFQLYEQLKLKNYGITDFEAFYSIYHMHNEKLWTRFRNGFMKRDELRWKRMWHTLLDFKIGNTIIANEMSIAYLEILPTQNVMIPYAKELVEYLSEKYPLHIITNGFEITQRQKLYNCGIEKHFKNIITSEKTQSIKPKPEIFQYACEKVNTLPQECIMIGDALLIDILGAKNAGMDSIYFAPNDAETSNLPTYQVKSLQSIFEIL